MDAPAEERFRRVPLGYDPAEVDAHLKALSERQQTLLVAAEALRDQALHEAEELRLAAERDADKLRSRAESEAGVARRHMEERLAAFEQDICRRAEAFDELLRAVAAQFTATVSKQVRQAEVGCAAELQSALAELGIAFQPHSAQAGQ